MTTIGENKEVINFDVFDVSMSNVILIGDSRSGKSTFINLIKNINYIPTLSVYRGTINPESYNILLKISGMFHHLNLIDTPGLYEESENKRSNFGIEDMISTFVKKDITKIHMILLAVNGQSGLNSQQTKSIMEILRFLGRDLCRNVGILITHCENFDDDMENNWITQFKKNSNTQLISRICKKGFFFTGAILQFTWNDVALRDKFIINQRNRTLKFLTSLKSSTPELLRSESIDNLTTVFKHSESTISYAGKSKRLYKDVSELKNKVMNMRLILSQNIEKLQKINRSDPRLKSAIKIRDAMSKIVESSDISPQLTSLDRVRDEHKRLSDRTLSEFKGLMDECSTLTTLHNEAQSMIDGFELLDDIESSFFDGEVSDDDQISHFDDLCS
jgi:GTP-binding protein EngB required for normal cell division